jgi:AraC-like DNA-binding protein
MDELAAACGMSGRSFRRRFRDSRGVPPAAYARTHMALLACDLLRQHGDWSVTAVAKHLGYTHAPAFVRAFRAELGDTPKRWRQARLGTL